MEEDSAPEGEGGEQVEFPGSETEGNASDEI